MNYELMIEIGGALAIVIIVLWLFWISMNS